MICYKQELSDIIKECILYVTNLIMSIERWKSAQNEHDFFPIFIYFINGHFLMVWPNYIIHVFQDLSSIYIIFSLTYQGGGRNYNILLYQILIKWK